MAKMTAEKNAFMVVAEGCAPSYVEQLGKEVTARELSVIPGCGADEVLLHPDQQTIQVEVKGAVFDHAQVPVVRSLEEILTDCFFLTSEKLSRQTRQISEMMSWPVMSRMTSRSVTVLDLLSAGEMKVIFVVTCQVPR